MLNPILLMFSFTLYLCRYCSKYILDALKDADTDVINLDFAGPLAPVKITPPAGDSFLFLVLPVRLVAD